MCRKSKLSSRRPMRALLILAVAALSACASNGDEEDAYVERPVEDLYNEAHGLLEEGLPITAARAFEEVERQHPYSQWATRSQVMAAFAFYQGNQYDEAIAAAERFLELHPGNDNVPYAHYLIGVSYYEQMSDVGRDQRMTGQALQAFDELIRRFPDSPYARDARLKTDLALDHLAGKEMEIGRYYLQRDSYVGAINRFRNVIERFQTTTHVPEALHRLTEAYMALGVEEEAERTAAVLGANFPGSRWYQDSYALLVDGAPTSDRHPYWNGRVGEDGEVIEEAEPSLSEQRTLFGSPFF